MQRAGTIRLVRHGQASWGAADYDQLSEQGRHQAGELGARWATNGTPVGRVVVGSLRRHVQTAKSCLGDEVPLTVDAGWDELDHVAIARTFTGSTDVGADAGAARARLLRWIAGEGAHGESYRQFVSRVVAARDRVTALALEHEVVTVFTSGGPISTLLSQLLAGDDSLLVPFMDALENASVSEVGVDASGRLSPLSFNQTLHLPDSRRTRY